MKINEMVTLIREDYQRYLTLEGKKFNWVRFLARTLYSESFSITFWFRVLSYLQCKRSVFAKLLLKPMTLVYRMNEHHLGIELPIGTTVRGG